MRVAAVMVLVAALVSPVSADQPPRGTDQRLLAVADERASVEQIFNEFGLFGVWAADCGKPSAPENPYVRISMPNPNLVSEEHDLGPGYATNRYSVLSAVRVSPTRLSVRVLFQPGTETEERQTLVFDMHGGTRRTMFNQVEGGPVRVKDGIVLARGSKTPTLMKCDENINRNERRADYRTSAARSALDAGDWRRVPRLP